MTPKNPISIEKTTLPNGVRVLTESLPYVGSATIGIWARTGSADERPEEAGITHLIEHMLFKGTERRNAKEIAREIEGRGGHLNAFTDKQVTCYYCSVLAEDAEPGLDVLTDMVLHSKLDPEELAKERQVVIEEIRRGEDDPESHVYDLHIRNRWGDHKLGLPIIGTRESVGSFERQNLVDYMDRRYVGGHILLGAVGKISHEQILKFAEENFGGIRAGDEVNPLPRPTGSASETYEGKEVEQVHFCIGGDGPSLFDEDYYSAQILNEIMGGGMSSRLWHEVREQRGLAYSIGSYFGAYSAGGASTVFGGTSPSTWPEVKKVVREQMDKMMEDGPSDDELAFAKKSLAGSLVLSLEGSGSRMRRMSRLELAFQRQIPIEETIAKLNSVSREDVVNLSRTIYSSSKISVTAIGPKE